MSQTVCSPWRKKGPQHYWAQKNPVPGLWGQGKPVAGTDMRPKADRRPHSSRAPPLCRLGLQGHFLGAILFFRKETTKE